MLYYLPVVMAAASGVGETDGVDEFVTVRRENMKLNIVHALNTLMTHMKNSKLLTTVQ